MDIADLISPECVVAALPTADKAQVLRELSQQAARLLHIDPQAILDAVRSREELGSTGVGQGVALPHARISGLERFCGLFARLERPIEFDAIDGRAVDLVFLLLIPEHACSDHLTALALVARRLRDRQVAARLRAAKNAAGLYELLTATAPGAT